MSVTISTIDHALATWGRRAGGWFVDLLVYVGAFAATFVFALTTEDTTSGEISTIAALLIFLVWFAGPTLYAWLMVGAWGQTLGKMAVGVKVVRSSDAGRCRSSERSDGPFRRGSSACCSCRSSSPTSGRCGTSGTRRCTTRWPERSSSESAEEGPRRTEDSSSGAGIPSSSMDRERALEERLDEIERLVRTLVVRVTELELHGPAPAEPPGTGMPTVPPRTAPATAPPPPEPEPVAGPESPDQTTRGRAETRPTSQRGRSKTCSGAGSSRGSAGSRSSSGSSSSSSSPSTVAG